MDIIKLVFVSFLLFNPILSANILFLSTVPSRSHHIWNKVLVNELLRRGHNVTMLTHEYEQKLSANFTVIKIEGLYEKLHVFFNMNDMGDANIFRTIELVYDFREFVEEYDFKSEGMTTLLSYPSDSFDLILYDITTGHALLALSEKFNNSPVVAITPLVLLATTAQIFGSPIYSSYMPFYCTELTNVMNIKDRFMNFIFTYYDLFYFNYIYGRKVEVLFKKYNPNSTVTKALRNITLLLANIDPVLEQPQPLPPNVIPVGGLHAIAAKPLPQDLLKLMDEAKHGAIVFSLGTNVRSDQLPVTSQLALLKAFSKLPQRVFWKFESEDLTNVPENVIIRKWLPQNDMLGHPNTVLLINHGGALSTQEALYHGVPIISIPFFGDQYSNVRRLITKKVGLYLDKAELTEENVSRKINTILNDHTYTKNVKSLSKKFRSQPQTPLQRAMFWIEHVLEFRDAEHLSSRARDLTTFELANLDVFVIFSGGLFLVYFVSKKTLYAICRLFKQKKQLKKLKTK